MYPITCYKKYLQNVKLRVKELFIFHLTLIGIWYSLTLSIKNRGMGGLLNGENSLLPKLFVDCPGICHLVHKVPYIHVYFCIYNKGGLCLTFQKKIFFICFNENLLRWMKNAFYFTVKALFVLKIFKFLKWLQRHSNPQSFSL